MSKWLTAIAVFIAIFSTGCGGADPNDSQSQTDQTTPAPPSMPAIPQTTTPKQDQRNDQPPAHDPRRTQVPRELVGTWDGDRAKISFSSAGDVTVTYKKGGSDSGTVVINGNSMTLYLSSGVLTISQWEITRFDAGYGYEFFNLTLDGTSYVRDVPK